MIIFSHLMEDLHVEISALGPPAEAYARLAYALAEVRKYLIPDSNDNIRQQQMREMEIIGETTHNDERLCRKSIGSGMKCKYIIKIYKSKLKKTYICI